ncbi:MAG: cytochrome c3 family protein [Desulfobacterales bacterium]|nr:cytochrome c3 family protein [Desulfobacterales bacterium]
MNTIDDKATEAAEPAGGGDSVSIDDPADPAVSNGAEKDHQAPLSQSAGPVILFFLLGLAASLVVGWGVFPKLLYSQKKQPFNFDHALHVEVVDAGCESCHFFRDDGSFSGVPKLEQCTGCHEEQQGESADEKTFVTEYVAKGVEVPWLIYSRQPDSVFFTHAAHVKTAKMECVICHGPIGESEQSRVYEENRITGYSRDIWGKNIAGLKKNSWDRMKMDDCAECHAGQMDATESEAAKSSLGRLFTNVVSIPFPNSTKTGRKSSVQTDREACFVCHK